MTSNLNQATSEEDNSLGNLYARALRAYCVGSNEDDLARAYDIARRALAEGASVARLYEIHRDAALSLPKFSHFSASETFFVEALAVYDMALRGYGQTIERLSSEIDERKRIELDLRTATFELARQRDVLDADVARQTVDLHGKIEELHNLNARLTKTSQEQAEFTYSISHDLMAPLNTIRTMLSFLEEDLQDAGINAEFETLDAARATSERMMQIVEDILGYSRAIGLEAASELVDLNAVFDELRADLHGDLSAQNAELNVGAMPKVEGVRTPLRLLFQNLVSNAIKFRHPDRRPVVWVSEVGTSEPEQVTITIADNGVGIMEEHFERIFGLFQRLHTYDEYPGTGLGLTLCQRVAANHGGTITLTSEPGKGTTFTVSLRKHRDAPD